MTQRNRRANPPARPGENPAQAALRGAIDIAVLGLMCPDTLRPAEAAEARWDHLLREEDGSGQLVLSASKAGQRHVVYVSPRTMNALAKMHRIKQAVGIDTGKDDRIFQMASQQLGRRIRKACSFAGLEGHYGGRSPRIGMAMDLVLTGASLEELMAAGRWRTPTALMRNSFKNNPATGAIARWYAPRQSTDTPA